MSTIKHATSLIWSLWVILALAGLNTSAMAGERTLRFGHYIDEDLAVGQTARQFANILNDATRGRLKVQVFPRSQLGSAKSMFDATREGSLDITLAPAIFLRDIAPKMDILGLPFLFKSYDDADLIFTAGSSTCQQMLEQLERGNMKGLAFWEIGFRHISTSRRQIKGPWDLKGLKIRTLSDQAIIMTFRLLGANPVPIPYSELYPALQRGVIDGQEGSLDSFFKMRLYETQKYLSLTRHSYTALVLVMNLRAFSRLSQQEQEYVMHAAQRAADWGRDFSRNLEENNIRKLSEMGLRIEENPDWLGFRKEVFYMVQEKFVREDGRNLLREIDRKLR